MNIKFRFKDEKIIKQRKVGNKIIVVTNRGQKYIVEEIDKERGKIKVDEKPKKSKKSRKEEE